MARLAPLDRPSVTTDLSVVVTVFNEAGSLDELYRRTVGALEGRDFELIFVDDGSTDGSFELVERLHAADARVRGVRLKRNFGQHPAMHAGLARARGEIVVTMDGDLQNPPEDLPKLIEAVEAGADVASGRRAARRDSWGRTLPSRMINGMLRRFTGVAIADFGCAFNAYRRDALEPVLGAIGKQKFTKAVVLSTGASVVEVEVGHAPRAGASRYSPLRLVRTALHVLAGFWPQPIQWAGLALGVVCTLGAARARLLGRRLLDRPRRTSPARSSAASPSSSSSACRASSSPSSASTSGASSATSAGARFTRSSERYEAPATCPNQTCPVPGTGHVLSGRRKRRLAGSPAFGHLPSRHVRCLAPDVGGWA